MTERVPPRTQLVLGASTTVPGTIENIHVRLDSVGTLMTSRGYLAAQPASPGTQGTTMSTPTRRIASGAKTWWPPKGEGAIGPTSRSSKPILTLPSASLPPSMGRKLPRLQRMKLPSKTAKKSDNQLSNREEHHPPQTLPPLVEVCLPKLVESRGTPGAPTKNQDTGELGEIKVTIPKSPTTGPTSTSAVLSGSFAPIEKVR